MAEIIVQQQTKPPAPKSTRLDDAAYVLPMAAFMILMWAGGQWPRFFVASYYLRTVVAGGLIILFWRRYTPIRWNFWWLGIIMGVVGIVQWVGVEELLTAYWPNYPKIPAATDPFDPYKTFASPAAMWAFIAVRWAGAALVVPFMEELFWRDWGWRTWLAPNDFKLASVGEWDWGAYLIIAAVCAGVHPQWITAIIWALTIGGLLVYTKSLGACIIAHGVTNFLLGAYVQWTHAWQYW